MRTAPRFLLHCAKKQGVYTHNVIYQARKRVVVAGIVSKCNTFKKEGAISCYLKELKAKKKFKSASKRMFAT